MRQKATALTLAVIMISPLKIPDGIAAQAGSSVPCSSIGFFPMLEPPPNATKRAEFARSLASVLERLLVEIPNPSPQEVEWLERELRSGNERRYSIAWNSASNFKRVTRAITEERLAILKQLSAGRLSEAQEMLAWGILAHSYHDSDFANGLATLADEGVIGKEYVPVLEPRAFMLGSLCKFVNDQMLTNILIPYLRRVADAKGSQ